MTIEHLRRPGVVVRIYDLLERGGAIRIRRGLLVSKLLTVSNEARDEKPMYMLAIVDTSKIVYRLRAQVRLVLRWDEWCRRRVFIALLEIVVDEHPKALRGIIFIVELRPVLDSDRLRCALESKGRGRHRSSKGARSGSRGAGT